MDYLHLVFRLIFLNFYYVVCLPLWSFRTFVISYFIDEKNEQIAE